MIDEMGLMNNDLSFCHVGIGGQLWLCGLKNGLVMWAWLR